MAEMSPGSYPRRVLLVVTGLTPQVVTESVYALATASGDEGFIPTEVHVITTGEGAQRARLMLLDPEAGQFHALCHDLGLNGIAFPPENVHVIEEATGAPLADIRTPEHNMRAADYIVHYVREFCGDESASLHVSIAGGRKTMGFFAGYALSLFGRAQDRLSHVLVNEPFESLPDFYFPPTTGRVVHSREGIPAHTRDARVMLAHIPFVRLRGGFPSSLQSHGTSFHDVVEGVQSGLHFISLSFDIRNTRICCGGKWIGLPDSLFAFYLWMATRIVQLGPRDAPVSWKQADTRDFLAIYDRVVGGLSSRMDAAEQALRNGFEDGKFFEQKASKINSTLKKHLPLESSAYQIVTFGERPFKKYGMRLAADQITVP